MSESSPSTIQVIPDLSSNYSEALRIESVSQANNAIIIDDFTNLTRQNRFLSEAPEDVERNQDVLKEAESYLTDLLKNDSAARSIRGLFANTGNGKVQPAAAVFTKILLISAMEQRKQNGDPAFYDSRVMRPAHEAPATTLAVLQALAAAKVPTTDGRDIYTTPFGVSLEYAERRQDETDATIIVQALPKTVPLAV